MLQPTNSVYKQPLIHYICIWCCMKDMGAGRRNPNPGAVFNLDSQCNYQFIYRFRRLLKSL